MKKVLPGGGTVIGIPKKQVMKFNIVTGFQNLVCFYAITKTNFEIKPLSQHPGLALKRSAVFLQTNNSNTASNFPDEKPVYQLHTKIAPLVGITNEVKWHIT